MTCPPGAGVFLGELERPRVFPNESPNHGSVGLVFSAKRDCRWGEFSDIGTST